MNENITQYRPLLFSIAYNMLGSIMEAEDVVQDVFLSWEQMKDGEIRSTKAYLCRMAANRSLDVLERLKKERATYFGPWIPEPLMQTQEDRLGLDEQYQLSLGFMMLLEKLSPAERTVYVLREVFDFSYEAIAETLSKTEANCRQLLKRARQHLQQTPKRFVSNPEQQKILLKAFQVAADEGEMAPFIALLQEDVELYSDGGGKITALPKPLYGKELCAKFISSIMNYMMEKFATDFTVVYTQANGSPAILSYIQEKLVHAVIVELDESGISGMYIIRNPEKLARLKQNL